MLGEKNVVMISLVGVLAVLLIITIVGVLVLGSQTSDFQKGISEAVSQREELQEQLNQLNGTVPNDSQREAAAQLSELLGDLDDIQNEVDALRQKRIEAEEQLTNAQHELSELLGS